MTFGQKIKSARLTIGYTQKQLAESIGAKHNSVSDWENDKNKPDPDTIELLCGVLNISPNYLLASSENEYSPMEKLFIKKYRTLDEHGKRILDFILDEECSRVAASIFQPVPVPVRLISYYYKNASAGTGQVIIDNLPEQDIEIPDIPKYQCVSYAIGVNGSSMEPIYHDGDILLVEATRELEIGSIGIFQIDDECFVKKLGKTELISLNKEYDNIPLNRYSRIMGKVIGKL